MTIRNKVDDRECINKPEHFYDEYDIKIKVEIFFLREKFLWYLACDAG